MTAVSLLILASFFTGTAAVLGWKAVQSCEKYRWTWLWILCAFVCQSLVLGERGALRGQCPLGDYGEILVFLAWSLSIFYFVTGPAYRLSLLGLFSTPVVTGMQLVAILPGMMEVAPLKAESIDPWNETHAAMSVLSYGAFALASVAAVMFLVLNKKLKGQQSGLGQGLFGCLPPIRSLIDSVVRLTWIGLVLLSVGIYAGFRMGVEGSGTHLWIAIGVWLAYIALLGIWHVFGMTPRKMASFMVVLFVLSLLVFAQ